MCRLKLTAENYYSQEANMDYMSASQFKAFRRCEAAAMAELRGEWGRKDTTALLVGSYVDTYFAGELDTFRAVHPELFKRDGSLKAEFVQAGKIAHRLESDDLARMLLAGKHQTIKTAKIAGVWFKGKFDSLLTTAQVNAICKRFPQVRRAAPFGGPMIVDLKIIRDFEPLWDPEAEEKVSFINYWGYDIQGAIYQAIDKRMAPFAIVAATKQDEPDIDAMLIPDADLEAAMAEVREYAPRYAAIKRGVISPERCGKCPYCRATKRLNGLRNYNAMEDIQC